MLLKYDSVYKIFSLGNLNNIAHVYNLIKFILYLFININI